MKLRKSKFANDVIITFMGQVIILIVAFGMNKVLSNFLSTEDFGIFNIIRRTSSVITYAILVAMGIAIPKYLAECLEKKDINSLYRYFTSALLIILTTSAVICIVVFTFRISISQLIFNDSVYSYFILPLLLYSVGLALSTFVYSYYRGVDKFYHYSFLQIFVQIITMMFTFFLCDDLVLLLNMWSLFYFIFSLIIIITIYKRLRLKVTNIKVSSLKPYVKELLNYGVPRLPGEFVLFSFNLVPLIIITNKFQLTNSSYFAAATTINSLIIPFFGYIGIILLPIVSRGVITKRLNEMNSSIKKLALIYVVTAIIGTLLIESFADFTILLMFDADFLPSADIIRITALSILPNAIYLLYRNPLDAISVYPYNSINLFISFLFMTVFMMISPNIIICSWGYVLGYTVLGLLSYMSWRKALKQKVY